MSKENFNLNNPDYFYKYLPCDRTDFFRHCSLRFSQRESLNDPFEQSMANRDEIFKLDEEDRRAFYAAITNDFSHSGKIISELIIAKAKQENLIKDRETQSALPEQGGILSLSETPDNILMWSHYASEHQGIVIEMDASHFFSKQLHDGSGSFIIHRVRYRDSMIEDQPSNIFDYLFRIPHDAMATKSSHWSYEQEWRVESVLSAAKFSVLRSSSEKHQMDARGNAVFLYKIPKKVISKVIFGANCRLDKIKEISLLLSRDPQLRHVLMKISIVDPADFKMRFLNLKAEDLIDN